MKDNYTSKELTEILRRGKNDMVSCYAAANRNCSPEILTEVLKRGKADLVSWSAAGNRNCPKKILTTTSTISRT